MYVYKCSVDNDIYLLCMIKVGLGGVLVVCEDYYNLVGPVSPSVSSSFMFCFSNLLKYIQFFLPSKGKHLSSII